MPPAIVIDEYHERWPAEFAALGARQLAITADHQPPDAPVDPAGLRKQLGTRRSTC